MRFIVIVISLLALTACGAQLTRDGREVEATTGAGGYTLKKEIHRPDGSVEKCEVQADSARDLTDANVEVGEDCSLTASIGRTTGGEASTKAMVEMMRLFPWALIPGYAPPQPGGE